MSVGLELRATPSAAMIANLPQGAEASAAPIGTEIESSPLNMEVSVLNFRIAFDTGHDISKNRLSPQTIQRAQFILGELSHHAPNYRINISALIAQRTDCPEEFLNSDEKLIGELREIVREALGMDALAWESYLSDQRSCRSGAEQLYACKGAVLSNLTVTDEDLCKILVQKSLTTGKALSSEEVTLIVNQYKSGKKLLQFVSDMLEKLKAQVKSQMHATPPTISPLEAAERLRRIEETIQNLGLDGSNPIKSGAILLEALFPLDFTGMTHDEIKAALKEKEERIAAFINERPEPREDKENCRFPDPRILVPLVNFKTDKSIYAEDKLKYAADAALSGVDNRKDFHIFGNGKPMSGELFFIQLQKLIATNATDKALEQFVEGSMFGLVFNNLNPKDQVEMQAMVTDAACKLRNTCAAVKVGPGGIPHSTDAKVLMKDCDEAFEKELAVQVPAKPTPPKPIPGIGAGARPAPNPPPAPAAKKSRTSRVADAAGTVVKGLGAVAGAGLAIAGAVTGPPMAF